MNKHVYFVRHGESLTNVSHIHYGRTAPLTECGVAQAALVARRLGTLPVERVISSPYERAAKTALPIANVLELSVEYSDLFVERRGPTVVHLKHGSDPYVRSVWDIIEKNSHIPGWKHSDEECFVELVSRAKNALTFLEELPESMIVVTSHGMFLKVILAHVLIGDNLDGRTFWDRFMPAKNIENTGIMHLEFTDNFRKTQKFWKLVSWNDHAHLE